MTKDEFTALAIERVQRGAALCEAFDPNWRQKARGFEFASTTDCVVVRVTGLPWHQALEKIGGNISSFNPAVYGFDILSSDADQLRGDFVYETMQRIWEKVVRLSPEPRL